MSGVLVNTRLFFEDVADTQWEFPDANCKIPKK